MKGHKIIKMKNYYKLLTNQYKISKKYIIKIMEIIKTHYLKINNITMMKILINLNHKLLLRNKNLTIICKPSIPNKMMII